MSRIDFSAFEREQPWLKPAWGALSLWFRGHQELRIIDPKRLTLDLKTVSPTDLAMAITVLVNRGLFEQVYAVVDPTTRTTLDDKLYESPSKIPEQVRGRFGQPVNVEETEVVPLLREPQR